MTLYTLDDYEVTREGRFFNKRTGKEIKPQKNSKGYLRVYAGGRKYLLHRLVALKYVPNPDNKIQVNHKDGNKLNNNADNLEWVSNRDNILHAIVNGLQPTGEKSNNAHLKQIDVDFIRLHPDIPSSVLSEWLGVSVGTINNAKRYKTFKTQEQLKRYAELSRIESDRSIG